MALVDYGAGRENIGSLYGNLRRAIADKGVAENAARQRDIDRKGLFGSGITTEHLRGMSDVGLGIAEFGQGRMDKQMANAEKSFGRRQAADERRLATLQKRADLGDKKALDEMQGIQMGMGERRNAFEDKMGEYSGKGIWGTGFGSDEVGWRTKDKGAVGPESEFRRRMRGTPQTGGGAGAGPWDPGVGGSDSGGTALGSGPGPGASGREGRESSTANFPGRPSSEDFLPPKQSAPGGQSEFTDKHGMEFDQNNPEDYSNFGARNPRGARRGGTGGGAEQFGARNPRGARREGTGGGAEQRAPEGFKLADIAPRSNKFSEGIMNTGRRSGPVQDNAPFETFSDAFRNARREKGAGAVFDWTNPRTGKRNPYTTDYK